MQKLEDTIRCRIFETGENRGQSVRKTAGMVMKKRSVGCEQEIYLRYAVNNNKSIDARERKAWRLGVLASSEKRTSHY